MLTAAAVLFCSCTLGESSKKSGQLFAMDTYMTFTAWGENAQAGIDAASGRIVSLEKLLSVTDSGSEVFRADHSGGKAVDVSPETAWLASFAVGMNTITEGALDITLYPVLSEWGFTAEEYKVPDADRLSELLRNTGAQKISVSGNKLTVPEGMMIDFGAVAKGYAARLAAEDMKAAGVEAAVLDLGGNVQTVGRKPDGSDWKIGIRDPAGEGIIGTLSVGECAVVTSGGYERCFTSGGKTYHHILDPATGCPAESGLVSVTVIGEKGEYCDALSTALFVLGADKARELWKKLGDFEYAALTDKNELILSKGISESFTPDESHSSLKVTVAE